MRYDDGYSQLTDSNHTSIAFLFYNLDLLHVYLQVLYVYYDYSFAFTINNQLASTT